MEDSNLNILAKELMSLFNEWRDYFRSVKSWDKGTIEKYKKLRDKYNKKEEEFLKLARS